MAQEGFFSFIYRHIMMGLAMAFVALIIIFFFYPDFFRTSSIGITEPSPTTIVNLAANPVSYADAVAAAAPAIVNIYSSKVVTERVPLLEDPLMQRYFGNLATPRQRLERSLGSGVIISQNGYLVSNYHVVKNSDEILVALRDGRTADATIIGNDPDTDLAVLKINLDNLPAITLGDASQLRVGDVAMAIGNPFGVGQTVTLGIISATGRSRLGINTYENFIQTDAAINPGNSGGGLINARGELIGINTAIFSRSGGSNGIGFAIPIDTAREVMEQIVTQGYVKRGWLGFETQELTIQQLETLRLENLSGVIISHVYADTPAYRLGLQPGDVLLEIEGEQILNTQHAKRLTLDLPPGEVATLKILRGPTIYQVEIKVLQHP